MSEKKLSVFERYLTVWVLLCIIGGILLGKIAPGLSTKLNEFSIYQVSIPIAVCLFFYDVSNYGKNRLFSSPEIRKDTETSFSNTLYKLGNKAIYNVCNRIFLFRLSV